VAVEDAFRERKTCRSRSEWRLGFLGAFAVAVRELIGGCEDNSVTKSLIYKYDKYSG